LHSALSLLLEYEPNFEVIGEVGNARALPASVGKLHPDLILVDWELPDMKTAAARRRLIFSRRCTFSPSPATIG
jgi:DNA-binding NarL/FixJ family response regulator